MTNLFLVLSLLAWQETRDLPDPWSAVGDNGLAVGKYQMHTGAVADVNSVYRPRTPYSYADRSDPVRGELLTIGYLHILRTRFQRLYRRDPTPEEYCKLWRYGMRGYLRKVKTK